MTRIFLALALLALATPALAATVTNVGPQTLFPLDVATVTTGGTAVTAIASSHRTAGGWIYNPSTATINLCISETSVASGTVSAGATTCITPGTTYIVAPGIGPVSVVSSDSAHAFSGLGMQ